MMVLVCGDVIQETRYTCLTLTRLIDIKIILKGVQNADFTEL